MIAVKNVFDVVEEQDGQRLWVEPIGLTLDLREWCRVDHMLSHFGPSKELWNWFEEHPQAYDYFRAQYHEQLGAGSMRAKLLELTAAARHENFTLLYQGDDRDHNTAIALMEYLSELDAYVPPET